MSKVSEAPGPVPLSAREGVFIHSFKCFHCGLHFAIFSWVKDKHDPVTVTCPECGEQGNFLVHTLQVSDSKQFDLGSKKEIFALCPPPGSQLVAVPRNLPDGPKS